MRNLSLDWMNRIADALGVEPELLLRSDDTQEPKLIARLTSSGAEALPAPRDAVLPTSLNSHGDLVVLAIEESAGEYRTGDQVSRYAREPRCRSQSTHRVGCENEEAEHEQPLSAVPALSERKQELHTTKQQREDEEASQPHLGWLLGAARGMCRVSRAVVGYRRGA